MTSVVLLFPPHFFFFLSFWDMTPSRKNWDGKVGGREDESSLQRMLLCLWEMNCALHGKSDWVDGCPWNVTITELTCVLFFFWVCVSVGDRKGSSSSGVGDEPTTPNSGAATRWLLSRDSRLELSLHTSQPLNKHLKVEGTPPLFLVLPLVSTCEEV